MRPFFDQWQRHRTPALQAALYFAGGLFLSRALSFQLAPPLTPWYLSALLALAIIITSKRFPLILTLFIVVGFIRGQEHRTQFWIHQQSLATSKITGDISFLHPPLYKKGSAIVQVVRLQISSPCAQLPITVLATLKKPLLPGETKELTAVYTQGVPSNITWESFPTASYQKQLYGTLEGANIQFSSHTRTTDLYTAIIKTLSHLSPNGQSFFRATILGERYHLTPRVKATLKEAGMSHFLAISGLHIALLASLFGGVIFLLPLPKKMRVALVVMCIWSIIFVTGTSASAIRALSMVALFMGAILIGRKANPLNTLGGALLLYLYLQPHQLWSIGLQFSVSATIAIIAVLPLLKEIPRPYSLPLSSLIISLTAGVSTLPIQLYYFGTATPLGFIANTLFLPFFVILYQVATPIILLPIPLLHTTLLPLIDFCFMHLLRGLELFLLMSNIGSSNYSAAYLPLTTLPYALLAMLITTGPRHLFTKSIYTALLIITSLLMGQQGFQYALGLYPSISVSFANKSTIIQLSNAQSKEMFYVTHSPVTSPIVSSFSRTLKNTNQSLSIISASELKGNNTDQLLNSLQEVPSINFTNYFQNTQQPRLSPLANSQTDTTSLSVYYHNQIVDSCILNWKQQQICINPQKQSISTKSLRANPMYFTPTNRRLRVVIHNYSNGSLFLRRPPWK